MDYEKKYNEILAWAKKYKARLNGVPIEDIFPELRESEDERIRKWLLECIENLSDKYFVEVNRQDVFAYLEKQKEQKPAWSEEDDRRIDAICELLENTSAIHPNYSRRKLIIWLKSLRPSWKPSEEQMEALMLAIEGKCPPTSYMSRRLEDLYDGLANTYGIDAEPEYYQHFDPDC